MDIDLNDGLETEGLQMESPQAERSFVEDSLSEYMKDLKMYSARVSKEEEFELWKKYNDFGDREALEKLYKANLGIVVKIANMYRNAIKNSGSISLEDLIQEGNIGLLTGITRYDPEKGALSTCVFPWIRQAIGRYLDNKGYTIRFPVHTQELWRKITREIKAERAPCDVERPITYEEIKKKCKEKEVSDGMMEALITMQTIRSSTSLDLPIGEEEHGNETTLGDFIEAPSEYNTAEQAEKTMLSEDIKKAMHHALKPNEYEILAEYFGLDGHMRHSVRDIAKEIGVTYQRVDQIIVKGIRSLRNSHFTKQTLLGYYKDM